MVYKITISISEVSVNKNFKDKFLAHIKNKSSEISVRLMNSLVFKKLFKKKYISVDKS